MSQQRADLLEKIAVLDEIRKKEHEKKTDKQLGIIAGNLLGRDEPIKRKTLAYWKKNEQELRRQAVGLDSRSKKRKQKNLRAADTYDFGEDLVQRLMEYSTHSNLTWDIIVDQARLLQTEKYPDLTRVGRKAENTVNLDFVRNILNEKG